MAWANIPKNTARLTRARGYIPGPSIRRTWPVVACAYGLKRTLTGISFDRAEKRACTGRSFLTALNEEQLAAIRSYDGPWVLGSGAPLRKDLRAE